MGYFVEICSAALKFLQKLQNKQGNVAQKINLLGKKYFQNFEWPTPNNSKFDEQM